MKKNYFISLATCLIFCGFMHAQTSTWTAQASGTSNILLGVSAPSEDTCYACGTNGTILRTVNGGISWSAQSTGTTENIAIINFINNNKGFAVGDNGTVLKTTNAGLTWTSLSVTTSTLRFVYFYDNSLGFIAGVNGLIKRTSDGGATWTTSSTGTTQQLNSIYFTSATTGYASGFGGTILKTTDGGLNWTLLTSGTTTPLGIIQFTAPMNGIVIGDSDLIRQSSNAGVSWSATSNPSSGNVLTGMDFFNSLEGFIVGGNIGANTGIIMKSNNGGNTWTSYTPGSSRLTRVDFVNANTAYAVGLDGTILKYTSNVGIQELSNDAAEINAYPNPFSASTTIDCGNHTFENNAVVEVYSMDGRLVASKEYSKENKIVFERNNMATGIYIFHIYDGKAIIGKGKISVE
ncbi:MAG: hypothetical protein JWO44_1495 [Bacteroidetes bacterium]|nr:hypothetical protein [Bacteroidota bacterium]